jgi:oligopeptide/dipeptide ABC transporter ATP-binding protein
MEQETFCLIGESGSGKSTLMNAILGLCPFSEGTLTFHNQIVSRSNDTVHWKLKSRAQVVFQNPAASLNPYLTIGQSIMEPIRKGTRKIKERMVEKLADEVGLSPFLLLKKPGNASGGQNQRACIARALAGNPEILFLDEPLSALDTVNKKEIAYLLADLINGHGLTCFMITHDLGLVKYIGTTVGVMYLGQIVEKMPVSSFFSAPQHPYSEALLTSCLIPGLWQGKPVILEGDVPSPHDPPSGCVFHPRCPKRLAVCSRQAPAPVTIAPGHVVCCHRAGISGDETHA